MSITSYNEVGFPILRYRDVEILPISSYRDKVIKVLKIEETIKISKKLAEIIVDYGFRIHYEDRQPFGAAQWRDYFGVKVLDCELPEEYFKWALSKNDATKIGQDRSSEIVTNEERFHYPVLLPQCIIEQEANKTTIKDYKIETLISLMQKQEITTTITGKLPLDKASSDCWLVMLDKKGKKFITSEEFEKSPTKTDSQDVPTSLDLITGLALDSIFNSRSRGFFYLTQGLSKNCCIKQMKYSVMQIDIDLSKKTMHILCDASQKSSNYPIQNIKKFKVDKVPNSTDKAQSFSKSSVSTTHIVGTILIHLLAIYCFQKTNS
jgi:hypothetical protein